MKRTIFTVVLSSMLMFSGFSQDNNFLNIKINTASNSENVTSNYTVEEWTKNTKLVSISFTNQGKQTEYIKNISVKLNETPKFGEKSKFIYGGSCMGRTQIQQRNYNDSTTNT